MYAWLSVFHIIGIVFWVGSLLIVTHVLAVQQAEVSPKVRDALGQLEMRVFKQLAHPGAAIVLLSGIALFLVNRFYYLHAGWMHVKLLLVALLVALDLGIYSRAKAFQAGRINLESRECWAMRGGVALVFSGILIMVLLKPL